MASWSRDGRGRPRRRRRPQHVLIHSWSVQSALNPLPVAGAEGRYFWDYDGKRYLDFAVAARQRRARPPAPEARRRDQGAGRPALHDRPADGERQALRARAPRRRGDAGRPDHTFFTNGGAEANENAIKLARWVTGRQKVDRALPLVPRRDRRRDLAHRRPAPLVRRAGDSRASCGCSTRTRTAARPATPIRARSAPAAPHLEEILQYEGPHTVAAVILETVTGTNGVIVPPRRLPAVDPRDLRPARDPAHLRRGDGGLRPHRPLVRRASTGTSCPDIITTAKGINSGYVPLGAMTVREPIYRAGSATSTSPAGSPTAGIRSRARRASPRSRPSARRASSRTRPRWATCSREALARARRAAPVDRRGARPRPLLGRSSSSGTARRASRSSRSTPAARRSRRWRRSARRRSSAGSTCSSHWNVVMVAPPLTITREELDEGLEILDEVLP